MKKSGIDVNYIFVQPPSLEVLKARLMSRGTETETSLAKRLKIAEEEIEFGRNRDMFPVSFVNGDFDIFYQDVLEYLKSLYPTANWTNQKTE